jgi:hypothetical protein
MGGVYNSSEEAGEEHDEIVGDDSENVACSLYDSSDPHWRA